MLDYLVKQLLVLLVSFLILNPNIAAQVDTAFITLKYEWDKEAKQDFYISEVIDGREEKRSLGLVKAGYKKFIPAVFKDGMIDEVQRVFDKILPHSNGKRPLKTHINRLWIGDDGNFGTMELSMEFFEKIDNKYVSIGVSHQFIFGGPRDSKKKHQRNIRKGLDEGIKEFSESDQIPLSNSDVLLDFSFGIDTLLKVGLYRSHNALIRNQKQSTEFDITRISKKKRGEFQYHILKEKKRRLKDYVYYDGKYIFLNNFHIGGSNFDYVSNLTRGRYLVYLNKVRGTNSKWMYGLLGALVDAATEKKKISVLDLKMGSLLKIDEALLSKIFENHIDIKPKIENSKEYTQKIISAFQELNDRLRGE